MGFVRAPVSFRANLLELRLSPHVLELVTPMHVSHKFFCPDATLKDDLGQQSTADKDLEPKETLPQHILLVIRQDLELQRKLSLAYPLCKAAGFGAQRNPSLTYPLGNSAGFGAPKKPFSYIYIYICLFRHTHTRFLQ